jgi:hypothetical protein
VLFSGPWQATFVRHFGAAPTNTSGDKHQGLSRIGWAVEFRGKNTTQFMFDFGGFPPNATLGKPDMLLKWKQYTRS